jgi:predicted  nucleic acid-binding Zn-ribbon protein
MPHQCVRCGKIIPSGSKQLLHGCESCGGKFFFFIKEKKLLKSSDFIRDKLSKDDIHDLESEVRGILGMSESEDAVVLDLETIKAIGPGKFRIDVSALMRGAPIVINVSPGKYYIDLPSAFGETGKENPFKKAFRKKRK